MKRLIVLISFIAISITANAQSHSINYVKDFDFLYKTVVNNSISFKLYCEETGLDSVKLHESLREELSADNSMQKFAEVSHKLFNASADMHNGFISSWFVKSTLKDLPQDEKEQTLLLIDTNYLSVSKENYNLYKHARQVSIGNINELSGIYNDGEYFLSHDFKIDEQKFSRGTKIFAINGIPTYQFYQENSNNWFPFYDQKNKQFYAHSLFNSLFFKQNQYRLTFESENGDRQAITINKDTEITRKWENALFLVRTNQLKYFRKSKTLYVRYITFAAFCDFINELEKYKVKEIKRVIVDVRRNGGGSDLNWLKLMAMLKPTYKIKESPKSVALKQSVVNKFLSSSDIVDSMSNSKVNVYQNDILEYIHPTKEKIEELGDNYKDFFDDHKNILNYDGEIYCLTDDRSFSASLTFASLKYFIPDFHVVSDNIPYYGGMGLTPLMFMLPESKMTFRLVSNFDYYLYNSKTYRIEPDIKVNETLEDRLKWYNKRIRYYNSKKYRLQKSKYFKAIENHKK